MQAIRNNHCAWVPSQFCYKKSIISSPERYTSSSVLFSFESWKNKDGGPKQGKDSPKCLSTGSHPFSCSQVDYEWSHIFPQGYIVVWVKRERAWKLPHARKGGTRQGERKMRDYRQSPSFWTYALLSQRKTLIGSSMEICQKHTSRYQHST